MKTHFRKLLDIESRPDGVHVTGQMRLLAARLVPAFWEAFALDKPAAFQDPHRASAIIGYQFAGTWLASVAAERDNPGLVDALRAIDPSQLNALLQKYADGELVEYRTVCELKAKYQFISALVLGFRAMEKVGARDVGVHIYSLGLGIARLTEDAHVS